MELFLHTSDGIAIADYDDETTVADLATRVGHPDATAWVEDDDAPLAPTTRVAKATHHRGHLHLGRCSEVTVTVRFGGDAIETPRPPGTTIQSIFAWATGPHGYKLTADQRAKHELGVCGTGVIADRNDHIGTLAADCALCLDLAPRERFQG